MITIKQGSRGNEVRILQKKLGIPEDGIFGPVTNAALLKYQSTHGLTPDGVVGPRTWESLGFPYTERVIRKIILHCEATPEGEEFSDEQCEASHKARNFSAYVRNGKVWHIGYHYIVHLDGSISVCRPESKMGVHCAGENYDSIGISYVGGCVQRSVKNWQVHPKDTRTPAQKASLRNLVAELQKKYPDSKVYGHYQFANKACPSFKIEDL